MPLDKKETKQIIESLINDFIGFRCTNNISAAIRLLEFEPDIDLSDITVDCDKSETNLLNFLSGYQKIFGISHDKFNDFIDLNNINKTLFNERNKGFLETTILAAILMKNGANPWAEDQNGINAFECALISGNYLLANTMLKMPSAPSIQEIEKYYKKYKVHEFTGNLGLAAACFANTREKEIVNYLLHLGFNENFLDINNIPAFLHAGTEEMYSYLFDKFDKSKLTLDLLGNVFLFLDKNDFYKHFYLGEKIKMHFFEYARKNNIKNPNDENFYKNFIKDFSSSIWKVGILNKIDDIKKYRPNLFVESINYRFVRKGAKNNNGNWSVLGALCWKLLQLTDLERIACLEQIEKAIRFIQKDDFKRWLFDEFRNGVSNQTLFLISIKKGQFLSNKYRIKELYDEIAKITYSLIDKPYEDVLAQTLLEGDMFINSFNKYANKDFIINYFNKEVLEEYFFNFPENIKENNSKIMKIIFESKYCDLNELKFKSQINILNYFALKESEKFNETDILLMCKSLDFILKLGWKCTFACNKELIEISNKNLLKKVIDIVKRNVSEIKNPEFLEKIKEYPYKTYDRFSNEICNTYAISKGDWEQLIYSACVYMNLDDGLEDVVFKDNPINKQHKLKL